ncbi:MAG: hypothetical protein R2857_15535 [Vampirovibrionales bacterium]
MGADMVFAGGATTHKFAASEVTTALQFVTMLRPDKPTSATFISGYSVRRLQTLQRWLNTLFSDAMRHTTTKFCTKPKVAVATTAS